MQNLGEGSFTQNPFLSREQKISKGARRALLRPSVHASGPSVHRPLFSRTCFRQKKSWEPRVSVVRKNLFFDNILFSFYFLLYWQHPKIERNPNWLWGLIWKIFFWQNDLVGNMMWSMTAITIVSIKNWMDLANGPLSKLLELLDT